MATDDLERRVQRLEDRFSSVADVARRREEDWGSVRAQANRIPELQEQVRGLERQVRELQRENERLARQLGQRPQASDIAQAPALPISPARTVPQMPSPDQLRVWISEEATTALSNLDIGELLLRTHPNIGQGAKKLSQALKRVGVEAEPDTLVSLIFNQLWERLDLDRIYNAVASQLTEQAPRQRRRTPAY